MAQEARLSPGAGRPCIASGCPPVSFGLYLGVSHHKTAAALLPVGWHVAGASASQPALCAATREARRVYRSLSDALDCWANLPRNGSAFWLVPRSMWGAPMQSYTYKFNLKKNVLHCSSV